MTDNLICCRQQLHSQGVPVSPQVHRGPGGDRIEQEECSHLTDLWQGVDSSDEAPDTSYYQWVTFMFCIQAALFYLPYRIWTALEGGLLASFGTEGETVESVRVVLYYSLSPDQARPQS